MWSSSVFKVDAIGPSCVPLVIGPPMTESQLSGIVARDIGNGWATEAAYASDAFRRKVRHLWIGENAVSVGSMPKPEVLGKLDSLNWIAGVAMEMSGSSGVSGTPSFVTCDGSEPGLTGPGHPYYRWSHKIPTMLVSKRSKVGAPTFGPYQARQVARVVADYSGDDIVIERPLERVNGPVPSHEDLISSMVARGRTAIVFEDIGNSYVSSAQNGGNSAYITVSRFRAVISVPSVLDGLYVLGATCSFYNEGLASESGLVASQPTNDLASSISNGAMDISVSMIIGTPAISALLGYAGVASRVSEVSSSWNGYVPRRTPLTGKSVLFVAPGSSVISCNGKQIRHVSGHLLGGPAWAEEFVYKGSVEIISPSLIRMNVTHAGIEFDGRVLAAACSGSDVSTADLEKMKNAYVRSGLVPPVSTGPDPLRETKLFARCSEVNYDLAATVFIQKSEEEGRPEVTFGQASTKAANKTKSVFHQFKAASVWGNDTFTTVYLSSVRVDGSYVVNFSGLGRDGVLSPTTAEDCIFSIKLGAAVINQTPGVLDVDAAFHAATGKTLSELTLAVGNVGQDAEFNESQLFWADIVDPAQLDAPERASFFMIHEANDRSVMDKVAISSLVFGRASYQSAKDWFKA